jgi:CO/xanthine dehydrogenase Mo-binding subunit
MTMDDICTPAPGHPLGAKGAGEGGYMTAPAAIISAIEDALSDPGPHLTAIPMTASTLYTLLQSVPKD